MSSAARKARRREGSSRVGGAAGTLGFARLTCDGPLAVPAYGRGAASTVHEKSGVAAAFSSPAPLLQLMLTPVPEPLRKVGTPTDGAYSTPSQLGIGEGITRNWPGRSTSQRSSMELSSCWVLWQCSM